MNDEPYIRRGRVWGDAGGGLDFFPRQAVVAFMGRTILWARGSLAGSIRYMAAGQLFGRFSPARKVGSGVRRRSERGVCAGVAA